MSQTEEERQRAEVFQQIGTDTSNLELLNGELTSRLNRQEDANSSAATRGRASAAPSSSAQHH